MENLFTVNWWWLQNTSNFRFILIYILNKNYRQQLYHQSLEHLINLLKHLLKRRTKFYILFTVKLKTSINLSHHIKISLQRLLPLTPPTKPQQPIPSIKKVKTVCNQFAQGGVFLIINNFILSNATSLQTSNTFDSKPSNKT